jgi:hypothetical protein
MRAHRTDGVSLTFALVFGVFLAWWAFAQVVDLELPALGWFVAGGLVLFGLLGLMGAVRTGRAERGRGPETPPDSAEGGDDADTTDVGPPVEDRP